MNNHKITYLLLSAAVLTGLLAAYSQPSGDKRSEILNAMSVSFSSAGLALVVSGKKFSADDEGEIK